MNGLLVTPQSSKSQAVATVLGNRAFGLSVGGVIRAGIKDLTRAAAQNKEARAVYEKGVAAGKDFDTIETEIKAIAPDIKTPLVPKNVPYFTVRGGDFPMPELAQMILNKYGEDRGDGVKRLYRFPVIFPVDSWQDVMPHSLKCYGSSQLKYWAEYSPNGETRFCMTYAAVDKDPTTKKAIRLFGGRKTQPRSENAGLCDPEKCKEYQARQCNLTGRLIFFIPGVPSINAVALPTNSFYSMNNIRNKLEMVGFMRGGRISGYLHGNQTFWITKKLHEVARIDDEGKPTRVQQWLIELEANIDVSGLLLADLQDDTRLAQADQAVEILNGESVVIEGPKSAPTSEILSAPEAGKAENTVEELKSLRTAVFEMVQAAGIELEAYSQYGKSTWKNEGWSKNLELLSTARNHLIEITPLRQEVKTLLIGMNIDASLYTRYAKQRFRRGDWDIVPESLHKAIGDLNEHKDEPEKLLNIIENELEIF